MEFVPCDVYVADDANRTGVNLWWIEVAGLGRAWKEFIPSKSVAGAGALPFATTPGSQFTQHYKRYGSGNYVLEFLSTFAVLSDVPSFVDLEH